MFCYIWEYIVKPEYTTSFAELYGSSGAWVELFRSDERYVRTVLLRDDTDPHRYVTLDYWTSKEACMSFRDGNREHFDAIDAQGDQYTSSETLVGDFDLLTNED